MDHLIGLTPELAIHMLQGLAAVALLVLIPLAWIGAMCIVELVRYFRGR